jgi:hypothetical protein
LARLQHGERGPLVVSLTGAVVLQVLRLKIAWLPRADNIPILILGTKRQAMVRVVGCMSRGRVSSAMEAEG